MSIEVMRSLFAHVEWANARVFDALGASPGSDARVLDQFGHLLAAEHVWITRLEGRAQQLPVWPTLSLAQCATLAQENVAAYRAFLDRETDASLDRSVTYTNTAGRTFSDRVVDILSHVALHGAYHRGRVAHLQRDGGGTPTATDFIVFRRGG